MNELELARIKIDEADEEIRNAFLKRMNAVKDVINYKIKNNLAIFDSSREDTVINKNMALLKDKNVSKYYEDLLKYLMKLSKEYQEEIKNGISSNR